MKQFINHITALPALLLVAACSGDGDMNDPHGSTAAPQQVTVREVKNYKGRSVVYYDLPDDRNLRYVRGVFTPRTGETSDVIASSYCDSLVFEGFSKSGAHTVQLFSVSSGEAASAPVTVSVEPLTPPYQDVLDNLEITTSFSGMYIRYENDMTDELAIRVQKKDPASDRWEDVHTQYTSLPNGEYAIRGQASVPTDFSFTVRDRWGNVSTAKEDNLTPWFEEECDKSLFALKNLEGDSWECHTWNAVSATNALQMIWDGVINDAPAYQAKTSVKLPNHITFDMGLSYQVSRFIMFTRVVPTSANPGNLFKAGHIRNFELWGCNEEPPTDGSFSGGWFKISDFESFRPSGATVAATNAASFTPEDLAVMASGEEFVIPEGTPPFRYVRIKTLRTWGGVPYPHISEVTFHGSQAEAQQ